jgi:hypothetical protein
MNIPKTPLLFVKYLILAVMISACFSCSTAPPAVIIPDKPSGEYIWPSPPATPKIKWLTNWSSRYDFGKPSQFMELLIGKERVEQLRRPNGVITDAAGNIYVADSESHIVFGEKSTSVYWNEKNRRAHRISYQ